MNKTLQGPGQYTMTWNQTTVTGNGAEGFLILIKSATSNPANAGGSIPATFTGGVMW